MMRRYRISIARLPHVLLIDDEDVGRYPGAELVEEPEAEAKPEPRAGKSTKARKGSK